jgi:hypothetical protein
MAPEAPPPSTQPHADQPTKIVTGLELRLVPSPSEGKGVLFERVAVDDHPAVANHLEDLREAPIIAADPIIAAGPLLPSARSTSPGQQRCNCWQSLRLLGSTPRHDHDHLTGTPSAVGCPACGRGLLAAPLSSPPAA